jgi:hypothetical protein
MTFATSIRNPGNAGEVLSFVTIKANGCCKLGTAAVMVAELCVGILERVFLLWDFFYQIQLEADSDEVIWWKSQNLASF